MRSEYAVWKDEIENGPKRVRLRTVLGLVALVSFGAGVLLVLARVL